MRTITVVFVAVSLATSIGLAQTPMRAGLWEVSTEMQMPGMTMPPMKARQCVTAADLQRDPTSGLPRGAQNGASDSCKVSDFKTVGARVTWTLTCTSPQAMTAQGDLTFSGDTYTGTIKMAMQSATMTMKTSGSRVGDCTR